MIRFLTLLLLLAYFWYWTATTSVRNVPKPASKEPIVPDPVNYRLESYGQNLNFVVDGRTEWTVELPEETVLNVKEQKLSNKDECFGVRDGSSIVATGQHLYEHLRKHDVDSTRNLQGLAVPDFLQNGNVFYFTCRDGKIDRVKMCPSGQIFLKGRCQIIDACLGKPSGFTFAYASNISMFYKCPGNDVPGVILSCRDKTLFFHDSCRKVQDFDIFCRGQRNESDVVLIDNTTRLVCRNDGKAEFKTCPNGQMFFDGVCESSACWGQPDGARIATKRKRRGRLSYDPGYFVCRNNRVDRTVQCPTQWNKNSAIDQAALSLPQVFDGTECVVPKVCENFWPNEPDAIVPVYNFSKRVRNWKHSRDVDNKVGYRCEGKKRKLDFAPYGHVIGSKHFKTHESLRDKTFLAYRFDGYYDKGKKLVVPCGPGKVFDGVDCRPEIDDAFGHDGLGLFRMVNEEWIRGWGYLPNSPPPPVCTEPESVYLATYNACFHPDCVSYPFLSQLPGFFIALKEAGHACRSTNFNLVSKTQIQFPFDYWTQRRLDEPTDEQEPCVPGSKVQSGHFVFDSIIYATCDHSQPFVFCPHKKTQGIILIEGKRWACKPINVNTEKAKPNTIYTFQPNELKSIKPLEDDTVVEINGLKSQISDEMNIQEGKTITLSSDKEILLEFRYLHTFPPDAAYKYGSPILSNIDEGGALIMKRNGFTKLPVELPKFSRPAAAIADFDVWMK